jgi:hypothetical protein
MAREGVKVQNIVDITGRFYNNEDAGLEWALRLGREPKGLAGHNRFVRIAAFISHCEPAMR